MISAVKNVLMVSIILIGIMVILALIVHFIKISKIRKYKLYASCALILGGIALFFFAIQWIDTLEVEDNTPTSSSDIEIESFDLKLDVSEDNVVDVVERITVHFDNENTHGIYRTIPSWLKYTGKDGTTVSKKSSIENITVNEPSTISIIGNDKIQIKIGDENTYISGNRKTYIIQYQYDMGEDLFSGYDEFIFHAFGDFWNTRINNATLEVTMPDSFLERGVSFYADKYRKQDITDEVTYYVSENTLYAQVSPDYVLSKSLTVDIELPEGYFKGSDITYGDTSLLFCILILVFLGITIYLWAKYGKDNKKIIVPEYYAPEGMDPAEIGYIYKNGNGRKLAVGLILSLASKGYIKIEENEETKEKIIVNEYPLDLNQEIKRTITATKKKDPKDKESKSILEEYFQEKETITVTSNVGEFLEKTKHLVQGKYIVIEKDTKDEYSETALEEIRKQLKEKKVKSKITLSKNEEMVYDQLFENDDRNTLAEDSNFYHVYEKLEKNLQETLEEKIEDRESYQKQAITASLFFASSIYWGSAFSVYKDLNPKLKWIYYISLLAVIIILIFVFIMTRKNVYGEELKSKISSFKDYLIVTTKNQLEELVKKNPDYYLEILPYAYVLGISKKWIEKFVDIKMPEASVDYMYWNYDTITSLSSSVESSSSSSGGCSSCGGGCSSCGGGGSW